jgi:hypothetical protein
VKSFKKIVCNERTDFRNKLAYLSLASCFSLVCQTLVSYSVFVCMFVRLRVQGFESSVNKEFQKKKLVDSETLIYSPRLKGLVQQELT